MSRYKKTQSTAQVTRIASVGGGLSLNRCKENQLNEIAKRLSWLRKELWNEFGSLKAWGVSEYQIDLHLRKNKDKYGLPAKLWEATLYDVITDIHLVQSSCIERVLGNLNLRYEKRKTKKSQTQLVLETRDWMADSKLSALVRKYWYRGRTKVDNQIVVKQYDCHCDSKGVVWIKFGGLIKGKPIKIPTTLPHPISGQIRLIRKEAKWYIHYGSTINIPEKKKEGIVIGVDRGYTEVYASSSNDGGRFLGENFGKLQTQESEYRKEKGVKRNKLRAIAQKAKEKGNISKYNRITNNNLGRQKWDKRERKFKARVKTLVFTATHQLMREEVKEVAYEDLGSVINSTKKRSKKVKRSLNSWCKGIVADALTQVSGRVGCTISIVNPCYTSQLDSRFGVLLGDRKGDKFIGFDGVVLHSDTNAADNVLARLSDPEITRWTKHTVAKSILLKRTLKFQKEQSHIIWDSVFGAISGLDTPKSPERPRRKKSKSQSDSEIKQLTLFDYV